MGYIVATVDSVAALVLLMFYALCGAIVVQSLADPLREYHARINTFPDPPVVLVIE
jgi:hypothetical protein